MRRRVVRFPAWRAVWRGRRLRWRAARVFLLGTLTLALALGVLYAYAVQQRYRDARASADLLQERYADANLGALRPGDLPRINADLERLETDLHALDALVDAPLLGGLARRAPIVGDDVAASEDLLDLGIAVTEIARDAAAIADAIRVAFEATGISADGATQETTWLDVVRQRRAEIETLAARLDAVLAMRAALEAEHLPDQGRRMLAPIDRLLGRAVTIRDEYVGLLPLLDVAFGADGDARYLLLLQNREEIRPGGGFPGTFAVVTIADGLLAGYESDNIRALDHAYVAGRDEALPSPGPIRVVLGQEEFLPHDALWSPDFRESAQTFIAMYAQTGWPPLTGVVGLSDSAIRDILAIVGPYQVEIDGELRTVSAETYLQLIESYRDQTWQDLAAHKHVVALLGASLIERVKAADLATKKRIYFALRDAADRREIQVYLPDPALQAEAVRRGWDGALYPEPGIPTLALTIGGLTGGKKSLMLHAATEIEIHPAAGGSLLRWTVTLDHRGDPLGNPVYHGYEYAWVSLYLPEDARVLSTSRPPEPPDIADDPRAMSFGVPIDPGTQQTLTIEFELPGPLERLLLRRQAGFNDIAVRVVGDSGGCPLDWTVSLDRDHVVLPMDCTVRPAR